MKVRFQADADLNEAIVKATLRRESSIDFQLAGAANLVRLNDAEVLALAAAQGRIIVTHDRRTMPRHFGEFIHKQASRGVIVVPQSMPVSAVADDLVLIWAASDAEEWNNRILSLPL